MTHSQVSRLCEDGSKKMIAFVRDALQELLKNNNDVRLIKRLTLSESTSTIFCVFVCAVVLRPRLQVNLVRDFESF